MMEFEFPDVLYLQWYTYRNPIVRVGVTAVVVVRVPVRVDVTGIVSIRGVDGAYAQINKKFIEHIVSFYKTIKM